MSRTNTIILGGCVAGLLDIVYAIVLFGLHDHVPAMLIGEGIASHVLGLQAFDGGWSVAILGFALHFVIAIVMAGAFYIICRRVEVVARHVLAFAPLYGLVLYAAMTWVIVPLTDPKHRGLPAFPPEPGFALYSALFANIVLVALPIALFTKPALKEA